MMEELKAVKIKLDSEEGRTNLLGASLKTRAMRSGLVMLAPGEEVGEHNTLDREEALIVLNGAAEITTGKGDLFTVGTEEMCYIPPNTAHNVKNKGQETLKYVYIVSPVT